MIHPAATQADDHRWCNATTLRVVSARLRPVLAANRDPSHGYGGFGAQIGEQQGSVE